MSKLTQFVVQDIDHEGGIVPVDNFIWKDEHRGLEVRLTTHADAVYVTYRTDEQADDAIPLFERVSSDVANGLVTMAEILSQIYGEDGVHCRSTYDDEEDK